jgi:hypothetical protein
MFHVRYGHALLALTVGFGCSDRADQRGNQGPPRATVKASPAQNDDPLLAADLKQAKPLSKSVYFENLNGRRRVLVNAYVCLREGEYGLECLLCRRGTKEHESILGTDADARAIHFGLVAAGGEPGHPVEFDPKFAPPTGTRIRASVQYEDNGKTLVIPAQRWIRSLKTNKELAEDWVFAGSVFYKDPDEPDKPPVYVAAVEGAFITVTSVPTAMLDLPIHSPKALDYREFIPYTERIPELFTPVLLILEPLRDSAN